METDWQLRFDGHEHYTGGQERRIFDGLSQRCDRDEGEKGEQFNHI